MFEVVLIVIFAFLVILAAGMLFILGVAAFAKALEYFNIIDSADEGCTYDSRLEGD